VRGARCSPPQASCEKVELRGELSAGQEWKAALGQGWVFRVIPIPPGSAGYSGWDLVVDREAAAGYPDALLLATPPYGSINEREVGTTFGVRAQDAIGWNPRSFHFLTDSATLRKAQDLFRAMHEESAKAGSAALDAQTAGKLMQLAEHAAAGQFRILDARLNPGVGDVAPFAQAWAAQSAKTPHELDSAPDNKATPLGNLHWMRFSVTLWLPAGWKTPQVLSAVRGSCSG
jgi:hypothetical protein